MVHVVGFPNYSQAQDVAHVFGQFGNVRVERIVEHMAALAYSTAGEARAAVRGSRALSLYGHFLSVQPYTKAADQLMVALPNSKHKEKIHQKGPTVDPATIPWSGDFHTQLHALLGAVRLSEAEIQNLAALYRDLELVLQSTWPGCRAIPFGSVTTGLGVKSSDADCFMLVPGGGQGAVPRARRVLAQHPGVFGELVAIPRANTPIVKFVHLPTRTHCDLSFKTPLGARNSELVRHLLQRDPRLLPVAVAAKYWAGVHELTGTGRLTNYALTMLVLFYLQQPPAALPPVAELQRGPELLVDGWDAGFAPGAAPGPARDARSVPQLLGGFFAFYAAFDFDALVVCPFLGRAVPKEAFREPSRLPAECERYRRNVAAGAAPALRLGTPLCVQDPLEQCHNVASPVSARLAADLRAYFRFAADAFARDEPHEHRNFLRTILLEKPALARAKPGAEFRMRLAPGTLHRIAAPDWRAAVRDVVLQIFETIFKLELEKVEPDAKENEDPAARRNENVRGTGKAMVNAGAQKENPDAKEKAVENGNRDANAEGNEQISKRDKEYYTGSVTRAIWKRKQFSKLYSAMGLKFLEREKMITEEILRTDKNVIKIDFHLVISFSNGHRGCHVSLKPGASDLNFYREFGKHVSSVMQSWFGHLVKPYCEPRNSEGVQTRPTNEAATADANSDPAASSDAADDRAGAGASDRDDDDGAESRDSEDSDLSYEDERINPNAETSIEQQNDTNNTAAEPQVQQTS